MNAQEQPLSMEMCNFAVLRLSPTSQPKYETHSCVWVAGRREVTQRKISGLQQPRRKTRAQLRLSPSSGPDSALWRRKRTDGRRKHASRVGSDPKWVACLRRLLEDVLPPKNTVPHPFLGLGLFVGDSLSRRRGG